MFILNNIPYLLFSAILGNIFYISFISIFSWIDFYWYFYYLQLLFFILAFFIFKKYKKLFVVEKANYFYLLFPYLLIIFLRLPIYTKVHDDLTYYLVAGEYTKNLWTNPHFLPTYAIYFYNALPLFYHTLVNFLGLRIALFISMFTLSIWMVSLNLRFKKLLKTKTQRYLADFFFISFPFWPHLMAIHGSFMTDFFSLVFILEAFYQFINKEKDKTFALISFIVAGLVKQSSIFYVVPVFLYLILNGLRKINWLKFFLFFAIFFTFFFTLYLETGNPLFAGLFKTPLDKLFKSPIEPMVGTNLSLFGGKNFFYKFTWPLIAQFSPNFAEGFVSKWAKIFFTPHLALPYLFSLIFFFKKRDLLSLLLFISFIFWSFHIGYARYVIPLIAIAWVYLIIKFDFDWLKRIKRPITYFLYLLIIVLSLSSIKSDFGWRPYHYLPFFKQLYLNGWQLVFKDRYADIKKEFLGEFNDFDRIAIVRGEKAYFYGFIGSSYGLKLIEAHNLDFYKKVLSSNFSWHLKNNLKKFLESKKILLIVDTMSVPEEYVKDNYFYKNYQCKKIGNTPEIKSIQFASFSSIKKYACIKN